MIKRTLLSLTLLLAAVAADAATVRGRVLRENGAVYPGAAVTLQNAAIGRTATVYTAEDGVFQLRNIPPGSYAMEIKTGRGTKSFPVSVGSAPTAGVPDVKVP
jgi:hypothetical protein